MKWPEADILAMIIAIGEARGGKWDYKTGRFNPPVEPNTVYAIMCDVKGSKKR